MKEITLDHLMQALGWTLLHSLWQTALIALCLYIVLAYSQKLNPNIRYLMGIVALLFTGFLATTTFLDLYFHHQPALKELQKDIYARSIEGEPLQLTFAEPVHFQEQVTSLQFSELIHYFKVYFNPYLHWIVGLWMTGVLALSLRFTGSLFYIHRLKKRLVSPVANQWQAKMLGMAKLLNLRQPIRILTSGVAKVPMMIGHLKPVILIPAVMISGLPKDQLEAIIAHEMAHIYRRDYWINILQSLFEIIFFFHPAIWWISSVIREEREKCCDDLAVTLCGNSLTYAKALASVEEVKLQHSQMALAMNGGKGNLFQRIERILEPGKSGGNQRARFVSASLAIILVLLLGTSGDSIAFRYGEEKVAKTLKRINLTPPYTKQDTTIDVDIDQALDIQLDNEIEVSEDIDVDVNVKANIDIDKEFIETSFDTLPKSQVSVSAALNSVRHLQDSLLAQAKLASVYVNVQKINPKVKFVHSIDTFPNFVIATPTRPVSPSDFSHSFTMDSIIVIDFSRLSALNFDSLPKLEHLTETLAPALAQLDSTMAFLDIHKLKGENYFYAQDTSIERRLRELEASLHEKEREFEKLMQEKEEIIQKLLSEKEIEWEEHEEAFNQQSIEQEKMLEEQERMLEDQMREQEEMLREQEEGIREQEDTMRQQESLFDEANKALEAQLKKDGLIKKGERYTFKISDDELYLNKEKLSEQYYQKYFKWMKDNAIFQFEEGSTLTITRIAE